MLDAQTTNRELVTAAQNPANNEAWQELHRAYHDPLVRHCDRSGLSPVEAEDVAALTLATLAMRLSRSSLKWEKRSLRGWLSETANRLIFDVHLHRKQQRLSADAARLMQEWLPPAFAPEDEHEAREKMESHLWSVCLAQGKGGRVGRTMADFRGVCPWGAQIIRSGGTVQHQQFQCPSHSQSNGWQDSRGVETRRESGGRDSRMSAGETAYLPAGYRALRILSERDGSWVYLAVNPSDRHCCLKVQRLAHPAAVDSMAENRTLLASLCATGAFIALNCWGIDQSASIVWEELELADDAISRQTLLGR
jgi:DNA-directed RNA polymerase specialized sigma24 family protein